MKVCSKCKIEKPFDDFQKDKSKKDGLSNQCKSCKKEYYQKLAKRTHVEIPKTQKCPKCNTEKPNYEFYKDKARKYGLTSYCKECHSKKFNEYYELNKLKRKKDSKSRIPKKKICQVCKENKKSNEFHKQSFSKDGLRTYCKKCSFIIDKKRMNNIKGQSDYNKRRAHRRKNDEVYRLKGTLRRFLRRSIDLAKKSSNQDIKKSKNSVKYIGCTIEELKNHLEKQFYPHPETGEEMTWENHAFEGWHVDHIKPLSSFDLTSEEEIMKANHYTNLQPLWAEENLSKGNSF